MKPTKITTLGLLGASLLLPPLSIAKDIQNLGNMIVTGTRTETDRNHIPDAVKVFTRDDIERLQVQSLVELFNGYAGMNITNNGGQGKATSLFMRGTNSDHVLVLIDGIKVGSATLGSPTFQHYPIDQIERIEIVKGPRSSLYGSEAIGGVIQIFTRTGSSESPRYSVSLGGGSDQTYDLNAVISGKSNDTSYSLGASHFTTSGFDARQPTTGFFAVDEPDDDGYDNTSFSAKIGHKFNDRVEVEAFALHSLGTTEFDATDDFESDIVQQVIGATVKIQAARFWQSEFRIGESRDENETFKLSGATPDVFNSKRFDLNWKNLFSITPDHRVTLGFDYRDDEISGTTMYDENSRDNKGIFAQYQGTFDHLDLIASFRNDDNEAFGNKQTGSAGFSFGRFSGIRLVGSFGTAFKGPSFNELYFPGFGNANLKPETSRSYEIGIDGEYGWGYWSARAYRTEIDDLIVFNFNPVTFEFKPENIDKALIKGLEIEFGTELAGWDISSSLSLISPEDVASGNQLQRRSRRSARLDLFRDFGKFNLGASLVAYDHRFDDTSNSTRVGGFATIDLRASYLINHNWSISGHINNLLDKEYQTVNTYNQDDLNAMLIIRYQSQ